jgi:hypothetical protein
MFEYFLNPTTRKDQVLISSDKNWLDVSILFFFFLVGLQFELKASSLHICKAGVLLLEPQLQSILL